MAVGDRESRGPPSDRARSGHGFSGRPYDDFVADMVTVVPGKLRLAGEGWSLRAERVEMLDGNDWRALIDVRRGLKLLVTWTDRAKELDIEAWAGEPEETDGVAVIDVAGDIRLARVPLCSCGERGCGNAGIQLSKWLEGPELPSLVDLLRGLPWTKTIPTHSNVLQGSGLAAIEGPDLDLPQGAYLHDRESGAVFPLNTQERDSNPDL